ncbi:MAG: HAD family hydrolase [Candidatus Bathyarchaeia archaeon]
MQKKEIVISLDFVGTVVSNAYLEHFWEKSIPCACAEKRKISFKEARELVLKEYEKVSPHEINWYLPEYWLDRFGIEKDLMSIIEESLVSLEFYQDALDFVKSFEGKCKMVITSGVPSLLISRPLALVNLRFHKIYSSADMRIIGKPASFYKFIIKDLGVSPSSIIHIGDDKINDGENPRKAGIKSYLLNRNAGITLNSLTMAICRIME